MSAEDWRIVGAAAAGVVGVWIWAVRWNRRMDRVFMDRLRWKGGEES